ncbi:aminopeptidase [Clostridiaceae bacterium M8S5]|nr:aminopeptidase [Clostridiaceae bacterium M8S5]
MRNINKMFLQENNKFEASYNETVGKIKTIVTNTEKLVEGDKSNFNIYFNKAGKLIIKMTSLENRLNEEYFDNDIEVLQKENNELYEELLPENYKTSYANPAYAVKELGDKFGQFLSSVYVEFRNYIQYAYKHKIFEMERYNRLFIEMYEYVSNNPLNYEELLKIYRKYKLMYADRDKRISLIEGYNKDDSFYNNLYDSLSDIRYLYRFGTRVTENEIKTAKFLQKCSDEKLITLANTMAEAYLRGYETENKDRNDRTVVRVICNLGHEKMIKYVIKSFKDKGLDVLVARVSSTPANKQYQYDHKFKEALLLDEGFLEEMQNSLKKTLEESKGMLKEYAGVVIVETFGEEPFAPEKKEEVLKFSKEQTELVSKNRIFRSEIMEQYIPEVETSFSIIAFPTPAIGDNFEEIFDDILKVNMIGNSENEIIQQAMIDVLDKGEHVHIKGKGANLTDLKVNMQELSDPSKQTNFFNCGADVNIPLGEVFTSPRLNGTNGLLHIEEVFLDGLKYIDFKIEFKDGYVSDYSCANFEKEEDNKSYIKENLLFPHDTLPMGEFAIGTNTLAYVTAEKYGIIDKLPILIVEKMGPHFAIGDTCYAWVEDNPVYNLLNEKEITARDNEKSLLRKEDKNKAYTNRHTDITIPYYAIEFISSVTKDGEYIDIIKDGRFVLKGTEALNEPFDKQ